MLRCYEDVLEAGAHTGTDEECADASAISTSLLGSGRDRENSTIYVSDLTFVGKGNAPPTQEWLAEG